MPLPTDDQRRLWAALRQKILGMNFEELRQRRLEWPELTGVYVGCTVTKGPTGEVPDPNDLAGMTVRAIMDQALSEQEADDNIMDAIQSACHAEVSRRLGRIGYGPGRSSV